MKNIIFIGTIGCGKTTLSQAIKGEKISYKKTQAVEVVGGSILDTPGEFLERAQMRGLVQSATEERNMFSPCYAGSFAKEVIGIVTKIDLADEKQIEAAENKLRIAGATKLFRVSNYTKEGLQALLDYWE